jgi:hypothetical protein
VTSSRWLSAVAGISLVYDLLVGLMLFAATDSLASLFGVPVPHPVIFAKLDALFLICVGVGFVQPLRNPQAHRAYLWVFGPVLKGAGAIAFVIDHVVNGSPSSFLVFAASDGALALATLIALLKR